MRVFKPTRKGPDGKQIPYEVWYVEFRDHLEIVRRLPAYTDKRQSEEFGRKMEKLVVHRSNNEPPDKSLADWLETIAQRTRDKLADIGLIDTRSMAAGKPMGEHVTDFAAALRAKGGCAKHSDSVVMKVEKIVAGCKFRFWHELSADAVNGWLAKQRAAKETKMSLQTSTVCPF